MAKWHDLTSIINSLEEILRTYKRKINSNDDNDRFLFLFINVFALLYAKLLWKIQHMPNPLGVDSWVKTNANSLHSHPNMGEQNTSILLRASPPPWFCASP